MLEFEYLENNKGEKIEGLIVIKPKVINDERGFFYESWNEKDFKKTIKTETIKFVQDNHSRSSIGVLRGLHYQMPPFEQGKLVRCTSGKIFDVAVDLRVNSSSFGKWAGTLLDSDNKNQLWIPEGFAHGFLTLSAQAEVQYKATNFWDPKSERTIKWDDSSLNIDWPVGISKMEIKLNPKDLNSNSFKEAILRGDVF